MQIRPHDAVRDIYDRLDTGVLTNAGQQGPRLELAMGLKV